MNAQMMRDLGFGEQIDLVENKQCPFCRKKISQKDFRDKLSQREFKISGLCQSCQDKMSGGK